MNKSDEIKSAALTLFAVKGYAATSMQEIADSVGLNKASLYFYTKGKKELYLLILDEHLKHLREALEQIFNTHKDEPLDVWLFLATQTILMNSSFEAILFWKKAHLLAVSDMEDDLKQPLRQMISDNNRHLKCLVNAILSTRNINVAETQISDFVLSYEIFIQGILDWRLQNKDANPKTVMPVLWDIFWNGSRFF